MNVNLMSFVDTSVSLSICWNNAGFEEKVEEGFFQR